MSKQSGIDINLGNKCSKNAYSWAKKTFKNREGMEGAPAIGVDGAFANVIHFKNARIGISSDGIGTKIELGERTGIYNTLGYDLVAMVVDDLVANGFEATSLSNIIDLDYLDYDVIDAMMEGLHGAAEEAAIAITGGEIAELGDRMNGFGKNMHFNWCSTAIGILPDELEKPIDGTAVKAGDAIVSIASRGFRSNGFSLVRRVMKEQFGADWHNEKYDDNRTWGELLLTPCLIYCRVVSDLIKHGIIPNGISHVTGGGLADNLGRVLKENKLGAELNNIHEPAEFVKKLQELGKVEEELAYRVWNMGNGMLLVMDAEKAEAAVAFLNEKGFNAKVAGKVTEDEKITIMTKGINSQKLEYTETDK